MASPSVRNFDILGCGVSKRQLVQVSQILKRQGPRPDHKLDHQLKGDVQDAFRFFGTELNIPYEDGPRLHTIQLSDPVRLIQWLASECEALRRLIEATLAKHPSSADAPWRAEARRGRLYRKHRSHR